MPRKGMRWEVQARKIIEQRYGGVVLKLSPAEHADFIVLLPGNRAVLVECKESKEPVFYTERNARLRQQKEEIKYLAARLNKLGLDVECVYLARLAGRIHWAGLDATRIPPRHDTLRK